METFNVFEEPIHSTLKRLNGRIIEASSLAHMRAQIILLIVLGMGCPYGLGQATSTASRDGMIQVGIGGTYVSPDYNPKGLGGLTYYAGIDLHYFGLEADIHQTTLWTPYDLGQRTYVGGPRLVYPAGRYRPYVRGFLGFGQFVQQQGYYHTNASLPLHKIYGFGGGLDILAPHKINIRAVDFEEQRWPGFSDHGLTPYAVTIGVAYRVR